MKNQKIKKGILLSFPRSGNHLVRFLIEFLTGRPTKGCMGNPEDIHICNSRFDPEENPLRHVEGDWVWCKHHWVNEVDDNKRRDKVFKENLNGLLFIFRQPMECILRHKYFGRTSYNWNPADLDGQIDKLGNAINFFLGFEKQKHVILYENLIDRKKREEEITLLSEFINGDPERLAELLDDLDFYYSLSLISKMHYKSAGCVSGEDLNFHSKRAKNVAGLQKHINNKIGDQLEKLKQIRS